MGNQRAETYLRQLAEAELRRVADQLRGLDDADEPDQWPDPRMLASAVAESALWKVIRAGQILVVTGSLDEAYLDSVAADLQTAIAARSRPRNLNRRLDVQYPTMAGPSSGLPPPSRSASAEMRVTPIGRTLRVASDRAPSALHLMSLVHTQNETAFIVVMRMSWPPDGSSTDLEITGAGPHHLPYNQLWAEDDLWTRYTVRFEGGDGGTAAWRGVVRMSPSPPDAARRLDLIGDGTCLVQLPLRPAAAAQVEHSVTEPAAISPGERLLVAAAERILASGDVRRSRRDTSPGELITVLTGARVIPANSPLPGQLAALCQRLGADEDDVTVAPAAELPAQWASVIARRDDPVPAEGAEAYVPLAVVLPDVDGAQFVLAGLSMTAGETYLHVVGSGVMTLTDRTGPGWTPVLSWWLGDGAGNWHAATASEPHALADGVHALRLRLTPPLAAVPDQVEVVVTGPATRLRATVPIGPAPGA